MRKFVCLALLGFLLLSAPASAQFAKAGRAGVQALKLGVGARAAALGESFVAMADDPSALYWNPSGIARLEGRSVIGSYIQWPAEVNFSTVGVTAPLGQGAIGVSLSVLSTGYMNVRTVFHPEGTGQVFTVSDLIAGVSYARNMTDRFSFGITAKILREKLEDFEDTGVAFDIGSLYDIGFKGLRMGIAILNFGPNLQYPVDEDGDGQKDEDPNNTLDDDGDGLIDEDGPQADVPLPLAFRVGFSMVPYVAGPNRLVTSLEAVHPSDNVETVHVGAEYSFGNMLFLRGGYKFNADLGGWTAGAGFRMRGVCIDYAYTNLDFLDKAQRATLTLTF